MIRLDLSGCTVASFTAGGGTHVVDVSRGGVICTAARTVVEDGEQGPRIRLLMPTEAPHSANSALRVSGRPKDEAPVYGPSVGEVE